MSKQALSDTMARTVPILHQPRAGTEARVGGTSRDRR